MLKNNNSLFFQINLFLNPAIWYPLFSDIPAALHDIVKSFMKSRE